MPLFLLQNPADRKGVEWEQNHGKRPAAELPDAEVLPEVPARVEVQEEIRGRLVYVRAATPPPRPTLHPQKARPVRHFSLQLNANEIYPAVGGYSE